MVGGVVVTLPVAVFVPLALPGTLSPFTGYTVYVYVVPDVMPLNATGNVDVLVPETGVTPDVGVYVMYTLLNDWPVKFNVVPLLLVPVKLSVPA